ncbi:hypothetical protein SprV_0702340800 [Sparganum proliferum]
MKICAAIYEAKREAGKSQLPPPRNANAEPPPTCPRCQRAFWAPINLIGHLRTNCSTRTSPRDVPQSTSASSPTSTINTDCTPEPPLPSSSIASISALTAPAPSATALNPNTPVCEPIIQTLVNQCLEHPHTLAASASMVHTAPAHSLTAWTFQCTCAFIKNLRWTTAGYKTPSRPPSLPPPPPSHSHPHHPPQAPNWKVCSPLPPPPQKRNPLQTLDCHIPRASGKCVSRLRRHAAPLLHA